LPQPNLTLAICTDPS